MSPGARSPTAGGWQLLETPPASGREGSPSSSSAVVTTRCSRIWLDAEDILHVVYLPGSEHRRADAEEVVEVGWRLGNARRLRILVDGRRVKSVDREARIYYVGPVSTARGIATALVIASPLSRVVGNVYLSVNTPLTPTRLFTGEDEALTWLRTFVG
jgi:hypothetical protein